jgi:hypothetical protein
MGNGLFEATDELSHQIKALSEPTLEEVKERWRAIYNHRALRVLRRQREFTDYLVVSEIVCIFLSRIDIPILLTCMVGYASRSVSAAMEVRSSAHLGSWKRAEPYGGAGTFATKSANGGRRYLG